MKALRNHLRIEGYPSAVAGVGPRLVKQVAHHLIAGLDAEVVQEAFDGVPNLADDAGFQHSSVVRQVFFYSLSPGQSRVGIHGCIHNPLGARVRRVDHLHQSVELRPGHDAAQAEVTQCLVSQDELQVLFRRDPVREDDDLTVAEGVTGSVSAIEVTLRAGSHGLSV